MITLKFLNNLINLKRSVAYSLRIVWKSSPRYMVVSLLLVLLQGTLPLLTIYLMKLVVDTVAVGLAAPRHSVHGSRLMLLIGGNAAAVFANILCQAIARFVREAQSELVADHIHEAIHAKSIEVDIQFYENSRFYDTLHQAQQHASVRPIQILNSLLDLCQGGISALAIAGLLFSFHWVVMVALLAASLLEVSVKLFFGVTFYQWNRERTTAFRRASYYSWMLTLGEFAKEIRLFALGPIFIRRFRDLRGHLRRERLDLVRKRSLLEFTSQGVATLVMFGSFAFVAWRTVQGAFTVGDLVMYYQALQHGYALLRHSLTSLANLYENNLFLSGLQSFLELQTRVVEPARPVAIPRPMQTGITFNRVSFHYPSGSGNALEDVTLTISPGQHVALVGENGAGKTTLIKLLCRLYDPTTGGITLDGIDLRQMDTAALRREIAVVPQDYVHYCLTAKENIWVGSADLPMDDERIVSAARCSGADGVIARLKHGYDTALGNLFGDGQQLSIGEWQKIALARAFVRDAQIIILDEPTSSLDPNSEYEFSRKMRALVAGRTMILISHRLSTVRMVDRIYVLEGGKIIEHGTHDELIRCHSGRYGSLFERQAQNYR